MALLAIGASSGLRSVTSPPTSFAIEGIRSVSPWSQLPSVLNFPAPDPGARVLVELSDKQPIAGRGAFELRAHVELASFGGNPLRVEDSLSVHLAGAEIEPDGRLPVTDAVWSVRVSAPGTYHGRVRLQRFPSGQTLATGEVFFTAIEPSPPPSAPWWLSELLAVLSLLLGIATFLVSRLDKRYERRQAADNAREEVLASSAVPDSDHEQVAAGAPPTEREPRDREKRGN
jgi:hypothetical protein